MSAVLLDSLFRGSNSGECNKAVGLVVVKMYIEIGVPM